MKARQGLELWALENPNTKVTFAEPVGCVSDHNYLTITQDTWTQTMV